MDLPDTAEAPSPWRLVGWWAASVFVAMVHNGLWATPNLAFLSLISDRLGENPFGAGLAGDYLLTDLSMTSLARLLGQTAPHEVARLHLVVLVLGWAAVVALARHRFGHGPARTLTVVMAASPLVTVSMQWLGQPDPVTGLCGIAMVLVRRWWAVVALGVVAGLTHPEQALFMAAVAGIVRAILPDDRPADGTGPDGRPADTVRAMALGVAAAVGGVGLGRLVTEVYFRISGITMITPRTAYLDYGLGTFLEHHGAQPAGLAWTLWGPLWLAMAAVAIAMALGHRRSGAGRAFAVMAALAVAALVPVMITLDETRVYSVITAPLLAGGAIWISGCLAGSWSARGAAGLLVVTAVVPGGFAAGITSWRSQLDTADMVAFLADGSVPEAFADRPTEWLLSPFEFTIPDPPDPGG